MDDRSRRRPCQRHGDTELKLDGLKLDPAQLDELLEVDNAGWQAELSAIGEYLESFAPRLPARLRQEQQRVARALRDDDAHASPLAAAS